jgi:cysteine desulfurase
MTENAHAWVYLDNNATTRMDTRVVEAMLPVFREQFANPSSTHILGVEASGAVRAARRQVQSLIGAARESEIVFTSGGSESNNAAILSALETQAGRDEIVTSAVEHPGGACSVCLSGANGESEGTPHPGGSRRQSRPRCLSRSSE